MTALLLILTLCTGCYLWYMAIIACRNRLLEALSELDAHLARRHDVLLVLFAVAGEALPDDIAALRAKAYGGLGSRERSAVTAHLRLEAQLQAAVQYFLTQAAHSPALQADATLPHVRRAYGEAEAQLQRAVTAYNAAARRLNALIRYFPGMLLGAWAGVARMPPYGE